VPPVSISLNESGNLSIARNVICLKLLDTTDIAVGDTSIISTTYQKKNCAEFEQRANIAGHVFICTKARIK